MERNFRRNLRAGLSHPFHFRCILLQGWTRQIPPERARAKVLTVSRRSAPARSSPSEVMESCAGGG